MSENIKVRWLVDNEQTKIAPKTFSTQILNEDGTHFKDTVETSISEIDEKIIAHSDNSEIHVTAEEKEGYATKEYVENLYMKLNSNTVLGFYCIEDVTIVTNGISKIYPANSNVEITFIEGDTFEIVPTSDNSILTLNAFPGALGTFYPWLEGVRQFSNILFDMNAVDMYSKWSQGNQGLYQVQFAQYSNCIFWSDNPYISDVNKRTNYTLYYTSQLPICYSTIPDNTFKTFFLALGVNNDPNWGNPAYRNSFAKANWATQAFSYYGARTVGLPALDSSEFNIVLPKDCRGLMFDARYIENAGVFDAINTTNFGAKSGSWRDAFGFCISLRSLYIKNLKVNLNISWSPIDYNSIYYIISEAVNTNKITISVSPYTYNLLSASDFELAASKNITIELLTANYVEDRRLSAIDNKADKEHTHDDVYYTEIEIDTKISEIENSIGDIAIVYETKADSQVKLDEAKGYTDAVASGKADSVHNHDDIYYTEAEINSMLDGKADSVHNHDNSYEVKGTVERELNLHNTSTDAHNDVRILINEVSTKLNNFLNVDDTTKDQLSELIALIDENADSIEIITSGKVNVSDIIDNLITNVSNKPLSAAQGVEIKRLIDSLNDVVNGKANKTELPTKVSELTNDSGFITSADVPVTKVNGKIGDVILTASDVGADASGSASAVQSNLDVLNDEFDDHVADTTAHMTSDQKSQLSAAYEHANTEDVHVTAVLKAKLNGIEEGATKTIIDSELSSTSENPVQNKVIKNALDSLELITVEDIDAICATDIEIATLSSSEVKF
jgi:hypothetical protein